MFSGESTLRGLQNSYPFVVLALDETLQGKQNNK
jgi:hypothetical protein